MPIRSRRTGWSALVAAALLSASCASAGRLGNPEPFPSAPRPATSSPRAPAPGLPEATVDGIVQRALNLRGVAYRWGGDTPSSGFDCSGLVWYVFDQAHVELPRTVAEQYDVGQPVPLDQVREGDLLFFSTTAPGPTHVGIALGSRGAGEFVHAPSENGVVRVEHFNTRYWRSRLVGVRRIDEGSSIR